MKKLLMVLALITLGASCAQRRDNNNNVQQNLGYQINVNGQCVQTSTGQLVAQQLCTQVGGQVSGFGYQFGANGQCIQTNTGQIVAQQFCTQAGGQVGGFGQQCVGIYIYNGQQVLCSGADCRGWTLIQSQTGQQVLCQ